MLSANRFSSRFPHLKAVFCAYLQNIMLGKNKAQHEIVNLTAQCWCGLL
ncbi:MULTISPECIES: hypothetical protein [Klebsiella]|nr:hypothetical protein [Klebsiella quasipneumoniae]HBS5601941.1 hypothetical protein [Klebsiella quasipneumoniae subsp. quasipneumoniae]MCL1441088.1 hypothetical protein [Klebsiella quasipneumoniae]MDL4075686.1 hypothetical protein [Klebsiella quasipneumoniae]MDZ0181462.1 hypothetical protein [Klebsiella quasipneumoniae]HBQ8755706.1 hypothetical protein [Klebsiella quasipneumoniae]